MNIFINFNKIFSDTKTIYLENTYRNSKQLIEIAKNFIEKNPIQLKKNLISKKISNNPIIFVPYQNKRETFRKLIDYIIKDHNDILILTRNNRDIYEYIDNSFVINNNIICYKNKELKLYTVHKSKGLEANCVVVLNCNNDYLGFPNKIENNNIIRKILPNTEIKFAEERRLFYVAITRCKDVTYLVYNKNNPSIFIKEIQRIVKSKLNIVKFFK